MNWLAAASESMRGPPCTNALFESLRSYPKRMSVLRAARSRSRYRLNVLMSSVPSRFQLRFGSVHVGSGGGFALRDNWNEL